jgi:amino acid transporter
MSILDFLFGRPLASSEDRAEHVGPVAGIPIFGLDALSSAAYGPEAALTLLLPLGLLGVHYIVPITTTILLLLTIVYFSYRQTIEAYPNGGGSYTVATENLGAGAGLLAAAALMIDYVLTAAVGISAGVGALVSALPALQPHTLGLCLGILALLTIVNLRGVHDTGVAFLIPTYLFVGTLFTVLGVGMVRAIISGGHPVAVLAPAALPPGTAMTGVEAVSNGVTAFRDPTTKNAKQTLTTIIALLIVLLAGIALLCRAYNIGATDPTGGHYQSVLSQLTLAVMGRGIFYYTTIGSILLVLALSANTAFADFPRLTRAIALGNYLPHVFVLRGRRLLYSFGIFALVFLTAFLLILFGGITDRLIPLYAIGAFLAFTLSQAGMVMHWRTHPGPGSRRRMFVNGVGALATGMTTLVVLVAKFVEGAWITALLIPSLIVLMRMVHRHYDRVARLTEYRAPLVLSDTEPPIVVIPIDRWNRITENGMRFALSISPDVHVVHVASEQDQTALNREWERIVGEPLRSAQRPVPKLTVLRSPYRWIIAPIVQFVFDLEEKYPDRKIAVLIPELVVRRWYQNFLHNQRAELLKVTLLLRGDGRILVINIPWYLDPPSDRPAQWKGSA